MPKKELTPELWVEKPYVTFGELAMVDKNDEDKSKRGIDG
jgi:hypothetical protein